MEDLSDWDTPAERQGGSFMARRVKRRQAGDVTFLPRLSPRISANTFASVSLEAAAPGVRVSAPLLTKRKGGEPAETLDLLYQFRVLAP